MVHSEEDASRLSLARAFGHIGDRHVRLGFNAKLSEMHAAMGLALCRLFEREHIYPRRYFYPSLTTLPYLPPAMPKKHCPHAEDIAPRALCLPLSAETTEEETDRVAAVMRRFFGR